MRIEIILLLVLAFIVLHSCDETSVSTFLMEDEEFTVEATDSMDVYVDNEKTPILFTGELNLVEGQCEVILYTPNYDTIFTDEDTIINRVVAFSQVYYGPEEIVFDEKFEPIIGDWEFFCLLQDYDELTPYGDYNFKFEYEE